MTADDHYGSGDSHRVGSVAEETARLLDALYAHRIPGAGRQRPANPPQGPAADPSFGGQAPPRPPGAGEWVASGGVRPVAEHSCPSCGHSTGCDPICRVCPVCRGAELLRRVSPDLMEQVASFMVFVGDALKDMAQARRDGDRSRQRQEGGGDGFDNGAYASASPPDAGPGRGGFPYPGDGPNPADRAGEDDVPEDFYVDYPHGECADPHGEFDDPDVGPEPAGDGAGGPYGAI